MKNLKVLILEDEFIIYMHIKTTLEKIGFKNIFVAQSYDEAMIITNENKIDLLFSDIEINGNINGIVTTKKIQSLYPLAVIFITAFNDDETILKLSELDFIGYLLKPYGEKELEALIYLALGRFNLISNKNLIFISQNYKFDIQNSTLFYKDEKIQLSKKELIFFSLLCENLNSFVKYTLIESNVWADEYVSNAARRTFFHRMRNKFEELDFSIQNKIGIGLFYKQEE